MRYYLLYHDAACHPCNSGRASYQAKKCSLKPCEENSDCDFSSLCKDTICTDLKDVDGDCVNTFECAGFCKEAAFAPALAPGLRPPHAPGPKCADFVDIDGECRQKNNAKIKILNMHYFARITPAFLPVMRLHLSHRQNLQPRQECLLLLMITVKVHIFSIATMMLRLARLRNLQEKFARSQSSVYLRCAAQNH